MLVVIKKYKFFTRKTNFINNNSLLNVRFGSLLGPRGLLLIYMWGENSITYLITETARSPRPPAQNTPKNPNFKFK